MKFIWKDFSKIFTVILTVFAVNSVSSMANEPSFRPICERSHSYVVNLLSDELRESQQGDALALLGDPGFVTKSEGDHMVASRRYTRLSDAAFSNKYYYAAPMQMGAGNSSGRYKTGLCWWHTRFHRAAVYLTEFRPGLPRPDSKNARKIMSRISHFKPVVIPGYTGLAEFTRDFPNELNATLSDWETRTTLFAPQHALGDFFNKVFSSKNDLTNLYDEEAWNIVDDLSVFPRPVVLLVDQGGLIGTHAFLGLRVRKDTIEDKIWLRYIDSEYPGGSKEAYIIEKGHFSSAYNMVRGLHAAFGEDFDRIRDGLRTRCGANYEIPRS